MDNFMEKITHKFTATDMIRANQQADAAELDDKKEQLRLFEDQMIKVDSALTEIRELNLRNIESAQDVKNLVSSSSTRMAEAAQRVEDESVSKIRETSDLSIEGINRTVDESLAKIEKIKESADSTDAINASMDMLMDKLQNMRRELEEYMHADHVKIYRNVQASFSEELTKQLDDVKKTSQKKGALLPITIITMLVSLANLALILLRIFGII